MANDIIAVKAYVPKALKRQAFAAFQFADLSFSAWVREQLAQWLNERDTPVAPRMAAHSTMECDGDAT